MFDGWRWGLRLGGKWYFLRLVLGEHIKGLVSEFIDSGVKLLSGEFCYLPVGEAIDDFGKQNVGIWHGRRP